MVWMNAQTVQAADPTRPPDQRQRKHYCRGCGRELPLGFRGHFHKECLQADKRSRIWEQRRREQERFKRLLGKQRCPHCEIKYSDHPSEGNVETPCEASRPSQERKSTGH